MSGLNEARVTINGVDLTDAQSMALRVAVVVFQADMSEREALGDDDHGRQMAALYRSRISEIVGLIHASARR